MYWPDVTAEIRKYVLKVGDVVIAMDGSLVGRSFGALSERDVPALLLQRVARVRSSEVDVGYLKHWICSERFTAHSDAVKTTTAIPHISPGDIRSFKVAVPPTILEQQQIGAALSDTDALIDSLEQLLTKKRQIKQGAMQELLTGKRRLPGFDGAWDTRRLGDIAELIKGSGLSKNETTSTGRRKCILYGELFTTYGQVIHEVVSQTNSSDGVESVSGDVLVPGSTTTDGIDLATASALLESGVALGGDINIVRPKSAESFDPRFLANYLTHVKKHEIAERAQGTTIVHLYGRDLSDLRLHQPSLAEQTAIAQVMSDMDAEIATLESRLTKALTLKQAMAQALLTGRIRLVEPTA